MLNKFSLCPAGLITATPHIYLTDKDGIDKGGFYPNGMNGTLKST